MSINTKYYKKYPNDFFTLNREKNMKLIFKDCSKEYFDMQPIKTFCNIEKKYLTEFHLSDLTNSLYKIDKTIKYYNENEFMIKLFKMDSKNTYKFTYNNEEKDKSKDICIRGSGKNIKYSKIISLKFPNINNLRINNKSYCEIQDKEFIDFCILRYIYAYEHIKNKGDLVCSYMIVSNNKLVDLIYLGLLLFKKATVFYRYNTVLYQDFSPTIKVKDLCKIFSCEQFHIGNKPKLNDFGLFINTNISRSVKMFLFKSSNIDILNRYINYLNKMYLLMSDTPHFKPIINNLLYFIQDMYRNKLLSDMDLYNINTFGNLKKDNIIKIIKKQNITLNDLEMI